MPFTILAVVAGAGIALLAGGRPRFLAGRTLRMWPLLAAGLVLQGLSGRLDDRGTIGWLLASYALLLAFAAANVSTVGMWLVATGVAMNLAAIALNAGMPVRPTALVASGLAEPGRAGEVRLAAKHHLARPSDRLAVLGDIIPVAPLGEVVSFGDVVMAVGTADVVAHLLARPAGRRRRTRGLQPVDAARRAG